MTIKKKKTVRKTLGLLGLCLWCFLILGIIGTLFAIFPQPSASSLTVSLIIVWAISFLIVLCFFLNFLKPYWWLATGGAFGITLLILGGAIHGFASVFSSLIWLPPLLIAFSLAWILPYINHNIARIINNEQFGPSTKLGKGCSIVLLSIFGASGASGALFGMYSVRFTGSINLGMVVVGIGLAILAVGLSQTFSYQMWEKRQAERKTKVELISK
jgi:hypothetical protein